MRTKMFHLRQWDGFHGNQKVGYVSIFQRKRSIYIPNIECSDQKWKNSKKTTVFSIKIYPKAFLDLFSTILPFWCPLVAKTRTKNPPRRLVFSGWVTYIYCHLYVSIRNSGEVILYNSNCAALARRQ